MDRRISIRVPENLDDLVEDFAGFGKKSEFYREAALEKLARESTGGNETQPAE